MRLIARCTFADVEDPVALVGRGSMSVGEGLVAGLNSDAGSGYWGLRARRGGLNGTGTGTR